MSIREATEKERKEIISAGLDERHVKMLNYYDKEIYKAIAILASAFTGLGLILPLLLV